MYGRVHGMTLMGVGGHPVTVEAFVGRGLPALTLTGLPGAAVADARDRIRPAVEHAGLEWPLRRVVINLAPGNLRKEGAGLDLPIAASVLLATSQVPTASADGAVFFGELSLKGEVLPTPGVLSVAIATAQAGLETVVVPEANAVEAAHVDGIRVVAVSSLEQVVLFLRGSWRAPRIEVGGDAGWQAPADRSRRCSRATPGAQGAGGRGRGRAQPAAGRLTRRREDDARAPPALDPARADA